MNVDKKKIWIPVTISLIIVTGTACQPQHPKTTSEKTLIQAQLSLDMALTEKIRDIAWKAYAEATNLGIDAREGPVIVSEFTLFENVLELGSKGDKIYEVRFVIFGGPQTRGIILVNEKSIEEICRR